MVPRLDWLDSLCCAACVTATDPVLASSVVGKGKFAKRVPKHLRDLISAESGCNDGMAFPFVYFGIYMIRYRPDANQFSLYWFCVAILYQCVFGAIYGVIIGYIARRAIRVSHEKGLIDRESFLVFYFVLALFCAGSGSVLGLDDLLVGFACGVGFSNDGWFQEKTEESSVSNVIDLLLNLTFFVYFGTIIPWAQFNSPSIGTTPWRLVVLAILVLIFRRIPIMLALKPFIPDIKSWREASFAGHFGPIGVGAIFVAILVRAEFSTGTSTPLAELPSPDIPNFNIIELVWPITTFLVLCSIVVHGSSVAVFTLGKRINTLTLTLSYTHANDEGPSWMDRLPRIQSRKSTASLRRPDEYDFDVEEKGGDTSNAISSSGGLAPHGFLRRQRGDDETSKPWSVHGRRRRHGSKKYAGGPISQSAITPSSRRASGDFDEKLQSQEKGNGGNTPTILISSPEDNYSTTTFTAERNVYQEGSHTIVVEDGDGNVLDVQSNDGGSRRSSICDRVVDRIRSRSPQVQAYDGVQIHEESQSDSKDSGESDLKVEPIEIHLSEKESKRENEEAKSNTTGDGKWDGIVQRFTDFGGALRRMQSNRPRSPDSERKSGPARAYQFGNTIIVEDEDGEVIKKYDMPPSKRPSIARVSGTAEGGRTTTRQRLQRMGTFIGLPQSQPVAESTEGDHARPDSGSKGPRPSSSLKNGDPTATADHDGHNSNSDDAADGSDDDDDNLRFTVGSGSRRLSKAEFINEIRRMDSRARSGSVDQLSAAAAEVVKTRSHANRPRRNSEKQPIAEETAAEVTGAVAGKESSSVVAPPTPNIEDITGTGAKRDQIPTQPDTDVPTPSSDVLSPLPSDINEKFPPWEGSFAAAAATAGPSRKDSDASVQANERASQQRRILVEEDARATAQKREHARNAVAAGGTPSIASIASTGVSAGAPPSSSSSSAMPTSASKVQQTHGSHGVEDDDELETAAERRRREGALGLSKDEGSDTDTGTESEDGKVKAVRWRAGGKERGRRENRSPPAASSAIGRSNASVESGPGDRNKSSATPPSSSQARTGSALKSTARDTTSAAGAKGVSFSNQQQKEATTGRDLTGSASTVGQQRQQKRQQEPGKEERHVSPPRPALARLRWRSDVEKRKH